MYVKIDFDNRIAGHEEFKAKDRAEQFDLVINSLESDKFKLIEKPASYSDDAILEVYNLRNKKDKLTVKKFKEYYGSLDLTDVFKILIPERKCMYWAETCEMDEYDKTTIYAEIWKSMLKKVGINLGSQIESSCDDDELITISFEYNNKKYVYNYSLPDYELEGTVFNDFDKFSEEENLDSIFLIDEYIADEMVGGYILPKKAAVELSKYLPVDY